MSRSIIATLLLVALALISCAGSVKPSQAKAPAKSRERLLARPPKAWHSIYEANAGDTRVADFVPPGQGTDQWTARLSFESYTKLLASDPLTVIDREVDYEKRHCSFMKDFNLFSGIENNYETATHLIICGKAAASGKGQVTLFKAIKGNQYFYIVRMVRRLPPFDADKTGFNTRNMAAWSHYFSKIRLCEPKSAEHPCPEPAKRPAPARH